jgi:hypothetical protein
VVGGGHEHERLLLVDFIEEPPGADAVSPGGRLPVLKPFDVRAEMGFVSEAGIDRFLKLLAEAAEARPGKVGQISRKPVVSKIRYLANQCSLPPSGLL